MCIIANNILNELYLRDAEDRAAGRQPASHDLRELAERGCSILPPIKWSSNCIGINERLQEGCLVG
jgi:hypothetical protein